MGLRRATKANPCPICGHGDWCFTPDDHSDRVCMRFGMGGITVPSGWRLLGAGKKDGTRFRDAGAPQQAQLTPQERESKKAEEEQYRRRQIEQAQSLADLVRQPETVNHRRAVEYFEARGVRVADLPDGRLPDSIRFLNRCYRKVEVEEKSITRAEPAVLAIAITREHEVEAVQRIYLHATEPRKADGEKNKALLGSKSHGAAVRIANVLATRTLVICEGVETGVALAAALNGHAGVWSMIDAGSLCRLTLTEKQAESVDRIIIAGDTDTPSRVAKVAPGEYQARIAANVLRERFPGVEVAIALPRHAQFPDLLDEQELPRAGKSVDWLDVYCSHGAEAVKGAVLGAAGSVFSRPHGDLSDSAEGSQPAAPVPPEGHAGLGVEDAAQNPFLDSAVERLLGAEMIFGRDNRTQAQQLLLHGFAPHGSQAEWTNEVFRLAHVGGTWYAYSDDGVKTQRWWEFTADRMCTIARDRLDDFNKRPRGVPKPLQPTSSLAQQVLDTCKNYVDVPINDRSKLNTLPTWLDPQFDEHGEPMFRPTLRIGATKTDPPIRRESVCAVENGMFDVDRLVAGERFELLPPSSRWLTRCYLPHVVDPELMRRILRANDDDICNEEAGTQVDRMMAELAPCTTAFIDHCSEGDTRWKETFWRSMGYLLVPDLSARNIFWWQGQPGQGKGTAVKMHYLAIGEENSYSTTLANLAGRFELDSMVGKLSVAVPELQADKHTDNAAALANLKLISGGDRARAEKKHGSTTIQKLDVRFIITPNAAWKARDDSAALDRRVVPLAFRHKPGRADSYLDVKLAKEAMWIFARSLVGLVNLRRAQVEGADLYPWCDSSQEIFSSIRRAGSEVQGLMLDCMVVDRGSSMTAEMAMLVWERYKSENKISRDLSVKDLHEGLEAAVTGFSKRENVTVRPGVRKVVYHGVRPRFVGEEQGEEWGSYKVYGRTGRLDDGEMWEVAVLDQTQQGAAVWGSGVM